MAEKQLKVEVIVPRKAIDAAIKARIAELEYENKELKDRLNRICSEVDANR